MTEEQLDVALARICTSFDTNTYAKIQVDLQGLKNSNAGYV